MKNCGRALGLLIAMWVCSASADTGLRIETPGGYVAFTVGDDWVVLSMQSTLPIAAATFQIPNPADEGTPESTNLALVLYDQDSEHARAAFDAAVKTYGSEAPLGVEFGPWTTSRQVSTQDGVSYTILDAKRSAVADVSVSVRLAWPHLENNAADYDVRMMATFQAFLETVEGRLGTPVPVPGETVRRPGT